MKKRNFVVVSLSTSIEKLDDNFDFAECECCFNTQEYIEKYFEGTLLYINSNMIAIKSNHIEKLIDWLNEQKIMEKIEYAI